MAAFNKVNAFVLQLGLATMNLSSDTSKFMLTNTAPVATNDAYSGGSSNISGNEVANGNGYTTGGLALGSPTYTQASGIATYTGTIASSGTWTASGSVGPFRYVVAYDSTPTIKSIVGWWDYGSSLTLTSGQTFTISLSSGIFTLQ